MSQFGPKPLSLEPAKPGTVRIFIVEDSDVTRSALRAILGQQPEFHLVGEAVDGRTAVSRLMAVRPDVVLVDIGLPGASGVEVTREFKSKASKIKALMFTSNDDDRLMLESFTAGADGYMVKDGFQKDVLEKAIRTVIEGKCWLDPGIANRILRFAKTYNRVVPASVQNAELQPLTPQEESLLTCAQDNEGACPADPSFLAKLHRLAKLDL